MAFSRRLDHLCFAVAVFEHILVTLLWMQPRVFKYDGQFILIRFAKWISLLGIHKGVALSRS
jgi:hypothetical protein